MMYQLHWAQTAIHNAIANPELSELLSRYGYSASRLLVGKALYDTVIDLQDRHEQAYSLQNQVGRDLAKAFKQAKASYTPLIKIARSALNDLPTIALTLGLLGPRKVDVGCWIEQAKMFYRNALHFPIVLQRFAECNVTPEQLKSGLAEVLVLEEIWRSQEGERMRVQNTSKCHDRAMHALERWMEQFMRTAQLALITRPHLLQQLRPQMG